VFYSVVFVVFFALVKRSCGEGGGEVEGEECGRKGGGGGGGSSGGGGII